MRAAFLLLPLLLGTCAPAVPSGPNVLLISIDTLRADALGCSGYRPEFAPDLEVSPNLDRLAREGVYFENAWSPVSWTLPAHMSLMTGLDCRAAGVEGRDFRLDPARHTLAEAFRAGGWETTGVYSGAFLDPDYGFGRGFDRYESAYLSADAVASEVDRRLAAAGRVPTEVSAAEREHLRREALRGDVSSPRVLAAALDFLRGRSRKRPFFLFLHFFDVHGDYVPDPERARAFDPEYHGPYDGRGWHADPRVRVFRDGRWQRRIGDRDLAHVRALYEAEVERVDRAIGEVLAELRREGIDRDTLIAVVADHGEEFFEHGGIVHAKTLYPEVTQVPLILRLPEDQAAGRRVAALVRLEDLAPTLLDLAGLPPLPEAEGRSLAPLVAGEDAAAPSPWPGDEEGILLRLASMQKDGWRNARYAVLRQLRPAAVQEPGQLRLEQALDPAGHPLIRIYDRREDPGELHPLPFTDPRVPEAMRAFHRAFLASERTATALPRSPLAERLAPPRTASENAFLDALGYAGGTTETRKARALPLAPFPEPPTPD